LGARSSASTIRREGPHLPFEAPSANFASCARVTSTDTPSSCAPAPTRNEEVAPRPRLLPIRREAAQTSGSRDFGAGCAHTVFGGHLSPHGLALNHPLNPGQSTSEPTTFVVELGQCLLPHQVVRRARWRSERKRPAGPVSPTKAGGVIPFHEAWRMNISRASSASKGAQGRPAWKARRPSHKRVARAANDRRSLARSIRAPVGPFQQVGAALDPLGWTGATTRAQSGWFQPVPRPSPAGDFFASDDPGQIAKRAPRAPSSQRARLHGLLLGLRAASNAR